MNNVRTLIAAAMMLMAAPVLQAQIHTAPNPTNGPTTKEAKRPQGVSSPLPGQLAQVKKIFLSNGGSDAGLFPHPFSGTQDRGYGYLFAALAANGRYQMVTQPAQADVVLELTLSSPLGPLGDNKIKGTADPLPTFKLTIYDTPTHYILWTVSATIDQANLQKTHDKNFDMALDALVSDFEAITK